jgi:hypothetical protein
VAGNLQALKHALRDRIVEAVSAEGAGNAGESALEARVIASVESEDVPVGIEGSGFGAIEAIHVRRPSEYPDWLIATTSVSIPYGTDTSLYLFGRERDSWKLLLALESNGYSNIREAQGWLEYHVSQGQPGKKPFLITAEVTPSAVSVWQGLRVKVLRPGPSSESPRVLASRTLSYRLDEPYYFSVHADGFGLIYPGNAVNPELAGYRGIHYLEYAVDNGRASIVKESAIDPYDVIRRWTKQNWGTASRIVYASDRTEIRRWHDRFAREEWVCGMDGGAIGHGVAAGRDLLLTAVPCRRNGTSKISAYVAFAAGRAGFRIVSISQHSPIDEEAPGFIVHSAGQPGLTDPVVESAAHAKLPSGIRPASGARFEIPLNIVVNESGGVELVSVMSWLENQRGIVVPAIRAARKWTFRPGMMDGKPVKVSMNVTVVVDP